jgi:large subunit ribosomal protein L24
MSAAKIKKGDKVVILSGKDKGKHGEVTKAMPRDNKVIVGGINMMTRHKKPSQVDPQGGLERIEAPMHVSNVAIEDPKTGKPTRVGFKVLEDGRKVRVAKRSGEVIDG